MTESEAAAFVGKLFSAFPTVKGVTEQTAEIWMRKLLPCRADVADAALEALIDESRFFPAVADFADTYRRESTRPKFQLPALPMPDLTDEERAANLQRLRELTSRYSTKEVA